MAAPCSGGMAFGIVWMSCQAVMPAVLGRAIDRGVADRDQRELVFWAGVMLAIGLVQAVTGIMRHRFAVTNWLTASYRIVQLTTRQSVRLGGSLPRKVSTGEVIAIGTTDLDHIGNVMDVTARFAGAIVSFLLVSAILLSTSVQLGLVVLIGVPLLMLVMGPILKPLQARSATERQMRSDLSNTGTDIVGGLRVLRGIGGEGVFLDRYRRESQATRTAAVNVAKLQSVLDALQVFLPGIFVVLVVWLGARSAVTGAITAGELVAFYGYSAFLMLPLRTATEFANKLIRGRVAAARVCRVLALEPDVVEPVSPAAAPPVDSELLDARSGLRVRPGLLTAIVSDQPDDSALLADRLGLCAAEQDDEVSLGGVPLTSLPHAVVRERIMVSDTGAALFAGRLADRIDERGNGDVEKALFTASAEDILEALPEGLDSDRHREGPLVLRRPAPAAGAGPRARRRPRDPGAGRADQRRRRPHRGADRVPAAGAPRGSDHGRHDGEPAPAGRGRRGGVPGRRADRRGGHPRRPAGRATRRTGPSSCVTWRRGMSERIIKHATCLMRARSEASTRSVTTAPSPTARPYAATSARSRTGTPGSCGPRSGCTSWRR